MASTIPHLLKVCKGSCVLLVTTQLCVLDFDVNLIRTTLALLERQDWGTYRISKPVGKAMIALDIDFTYRNCKASLHA
jgi:hypothetical protein